MHMKLMLERIAAAAAAAAGFLESILNIVVMPMARGLLLLRENEMRVMRQCDRKVVGLRWYRSCRGAWMEIGVGLMVFRLESEIRLLL